MIKPFAFIMIVLVLTACSLVVVTNQKNTDHENGIKNMNRSSITKVTQNQPSKSASQASEPASQ